MCLRFVFLLVGESPRGCGCPSARRRGKTAEILILRHQLAILQRRQPRRPKLNWADRALIATLLGVIPRRRRHGLRLLVTPDTIMRWHPDIVRRRWAVRSACGKTRRPATRRNIKALVLRLAREDSGWGTEGSMASWPDWESKSQRRPSGRSSGPAASTPRGGGPGRPGQSSCAPRPTRSWRATSSRPICSTALRPTSWP
jgi:hypothetical protein